MIRKTSFYASFSRFLLGVCALLLTLATLPGCHEQKARSATLYVFGTLVEVKTWGVPAHQADAAFAEIQQMFDRMHQQWHAWEPGLLTSINQSFARGEPAEASDEIVYLVRRSQELERLSGGRFNPAIGGVIGLWGFHTSDYPIVGPPPARGLIDDWLEQAPSTLDITIEGQVMASSNPAVQLDFGGVAKGYAVDLAIERLRAMGIDNAIVNAGGDLRAMGRHGERAWRIAVRKPGGGVIGALEVQGDEALFTSGNYERFRQDQDLRYPHILDPRTGWPVSDLSSVTVIAGHGLEADAAATALVVAGLEQWPQVARSMGLEQVLVVDVEGRVYSTPAMIERVRLVGEAEPVVVQLAGD